MKTIITIGRQFGSGGKEVGIRVAKELGIPFYDKELLQEAAKKSGLCEKIFQNFDERPKSLLYSIAMDSYMFSLPGSGGKEVGIRVAKELGIPFYDKELLQEAAKKSGLCEKIFENFDERPKSLLYSIAMDSYMFALPGTGAGDSLEQQVYLATFDTIRHIASQGPCVMIGRCADYALADNPNHLSIFIHAPMDVRIQRVAKRQNISPEEARKLIIKTDKRRASYYEYYSSQKWGAVESYDFCIDSSYLGLGGTVELIQTMVAQKEHPIPSPTEEDPTQKK